MPKRRSGAAPADQLSLWGDLIEPAGSPAPPPDAPSRSREDPPLSLVADVSRPEPRTEAVSRASAPRPPSRFRPTHQEQLAPSGARARARANIAAIQVLRQLQADGRPATAQEQQTLARWSSWGAVPEIFDERRPEWENQRAQLRELLDEAAYDAARRTTLNAHYTDPAIVREIWAALHRLGLEHGRVLEPGSGAGTFIGMAPAGADMVGVELDPTTAAIAQALYPDATIRTESFTDTRFPDGHFDAAIGNVPFSDARLHDPHHNRGRHSLHNHFIIKSLRLTRPGGLVALLTSRYTLDAQNPAARGEIHELAELIGAVRLPSGAHFRAAGTRVVTDLLLLRRREPGTDPGAAEWLRTEPVELGREGLRANTYFNQHPDHLLGRYQLGHGLRGSPDLTVEPRDDRPLAEQLAQALHSITAAASSGQRLAPRPAPELAPEAESAVVAAAADLWDGHLTAHADGSFSVVADQQHIPFTVPVKRRVELRALLDLRDTARELLDAEAITVGDQPRLDELRFHLRAGYERYVARYGPINRFTLRRTGRSDEDGNPRMARILPTVMRLLRGDPYAPLVKALENFDEVTQTTKPATLLSRRTLRPREPVRGVERPEEALVVCLEMHGRLELPRIAELLGVTRAEARHALGDLVFDDPVTGELIPAAEYLSGNVRVKHEQAVAAASKRPEFDVNVAALAAVIPPDLGADEVKARMGAVWIDEATHQQFLREILRDEGLRVEHACGGVWAVRGNRQSLEAKTEWGTARMPAPDLARDILEQRPIKVTDEDDEGRRIINAVETAAAADKAEAMQERFAEWVWEDQKRAQRLLAEYNRRFNAIVVRDYSADGERLTLPGLAETFIPRAHQRTAVARMLNEPAVGLFHAVGAGKTAEAVMGSMELRRLRLVNKPAIVVPNHMLEQFTREFLQLYPHARLLAASSEDLARDRRRSFVARVAVNDWDAVVMTRSAFERLPVHPTTEAGYIRGQVAELRAALDAIDNERGLSVKRLEAKLLKAESALEKRLEGVVDPGITFEASGIDYLIVDEFHDYKNLATVSNIPDAAIEGSKRASDMHMKLEYLRDQPGERTVTAMTATPIANSITEWHVMARHLRPDLLEDAGILAFDAWAATFAQVINQIEMAPSGGGRYRLKGRCARFQNVPDMLRIQGVFADVQTSEDLQLPTPLLAEREDGRRLPETVIVPASQEVRDYVAELGARADRLVGVNPREDNMLLISTDGRKAALDMRMVDPDADCSGTAKLDIAAANIARIWAEHRDRIYLDPDTGEPSPLRGAFQLVFCDLGTPGPGWNAYDELREQLIARGVPDEGVRFIHEARTDVEKGRLFAAARAGHIAVLIGSTSKLGVGTNVQTRCIALHHIDCPWRPADIEQRDGRILRQGNQNEEVYIFRYVVEGSFDGYSWQTVERKAGFIAQIMRGRLDVREIDDIGDNALSYAEVKALASGDTLLLEKAEADNARAQLVRRLRAYEKNRWILSGTLAEAEDVVARRTADYDAIQRALRIRRDSRGDAFKMTVGDRVALRRSEAAALIAAWISQATDGVGTRFSETSLGQLGELGGFQIEAAVYWDRFEDERAVVLSLPVLPCKDVSMRLSAAIDDSSPLVRAVEYRIADLPALAQRVDAERRRAAAQGAQASEALKAPFKHAAALAAAEHRCIEIEERMTRQEGVRAEEATGAEARSPDLVVVQGGGEADQPADSPASLRAVA